MAPTKPKDTPEILELIKAPRLGIPDLKTNLYLCILRQFYGQTIFQKNRDQRRRRFTIVRQPRSLRWN
jgi:hypothetical protein